MAGQISKITQIGMVTADLDKMVKYYEEMLGVGPWTVVADTKKGIGAPATNTKVNGKRVDFDVKVAICMLDGFELEIIQPMDDKSICRTFEKTRRRCDQPYCDCNTGQCEIP